MIDKWVSWQKGKKKRRQKKQDKLAVGVIEKKISFEEYNNNMF